jgi:hypothetical protein
MSVHRVSGATATSKAEIIIIIEVFTCVLLQQPNCQLQIQHKYIETNTSQITMNKLK